MRTDRLGVDVFFSSLGVTDLSWRTDTAEGEREIDLLLGVVGRERGVLNGERAGEEFSRAFVVLLETFSSTFPFLNLSLCGVVAPAADPFTDSNDSTEGSAISGSRSIFHTAEGLKGFLLWSLIEHVLSNHVTLG